VIRHHRIWKCLFCVWMMPSPVPRNGDRCHHPPPKWRMMASPASENIFSRPLEATVTSLYWWKRVTISATCFKKKRALLENRFFSNHYVRKSYRRRGLTPIGDAVYLRLRCEVIGDEGHWRRRLLTRVSYDPHIGDAGCSMMN